MPSTNTRSLGVKVSAVQTAAFTASEETGFYICDATGGAFTVTLPDATKRTQFENGFGGILTFKRINSGVNDVTIDGNGSQTIDGATTYVLNAQYDVLQIISDGSNWHAIVRT